MKHLQLALKVCESCGTLWLRQQNDASVYCAACTVQLARLPIIRTKHAGGRPACSTRTRVLRGRCNGATSAARASRTPAVESAAAQGGAE